MPAQAKAFKLHTGARAELQDSVAYYREKAGERWAARFKERVAEGVTAIASNPERHSPVRELEGVRRLRIKQFPFSILYINRPDYIWIVAVAHGSRKPGYWQKRIA